MTVLYVLPGTAAAINDTVGVDGFVIAPGAEITGSSFCGDAIGLHRLPSARYSERRGAIYSGGVDSGSTLIAVARSAARLRRMSRGACRRTEFSPA